MNWPFARKLHAWRKSLGVSACLVALSAISAVHASVVYPVKKHHKTPSQSRIQLKSQAMQVASGIHAAETALSPQELAVAGRIEVGRMPCELGAFVSVAADAHVPGYFDVQISKLKFRMAPVVTSTGAIRLEDPKAGAVWLQLSNKSMLMNQKTGTRLADACMSPAQLVVAEAMIKNPPPSLLEPLPVVVSPAEPSQAAIEIPVSTVR
ncbi:hypothetical protein [Rhodoferax sp.]|uniref:hypothetical protein n=1 Tax=Rhodoferax sp. TaxID=50421 RepID=UPI0028435DF4|nr:hypothetical protein [Rhodoferax sp.]MDR3370595.1 hypothetical protein [Rhodoferax sp.]